MLIGGRAHSLEETAWVGEARLDFAEINLCTSHRAFQEIPRLIRLKEQYNFFFLVHGPEEGNPFDCSLLRSSLLPRIKILVSCASELAAQLITVHFWLDERYIQPSVLSEKLTILEEMLAFAREKKIFLCLENLSERTSDLSPAFRLFPDLGLTLDIGHSQLLGRLRELEKAGYIAKRFDHKWILITRVAALGIPEPSGVLGITPGEQLVVPGGITQNVILEPHDAPGKAQGGLHDSQPVAAPQKAYSEKVAAHFNVPASLDSMGEAGAGKIGPCRGCEKPTPLRYGNESICPKCARAWGKPNDVVQN